MPANSVEQALATNFCESHRLIKMTAGKSQLVNFLGSELMSCQHTSQCVAIFLILFLLVSSAHSDETPYEIGLRANVLLGDGVPANDILGLGVIGRYRLKDGWFVGAGLDVYQYDFERPWRLVGIEQDPSVTTIDASADNTVISGSFGRLYNQTDHGFDWFWTLGVGLAFPNVDDVAGPTDSGGRFDLTFDVGNEIHLMATLGSSYNFSESWSASFAARVEYHFMDVLITDRVSGNTATVDSQSVTGASLSLNYRF